MILFVGPVFLTLNQNVAQCDSASETYALQTASLFDSLGLSALGYSYINIDDCWSLRDRSSDGALVPDPDKWPRGIRPVVDEIHAMGLQFGLYGCAGTLTCASFPGSWGHEQQDAELLAEWDVDFWKHDNCYTPCADPPGQDEVQVCNNPEGHTRDWYGTMRDALASVREQKNIMFNLCVWGVNSPWEWADDYGNSWRIDHDNWQDWESIVRIGSRAAPISEFSGPGGFNDLDMLIIGNDVLTEAQERLHFGLWSICKSPLILGTDLSTISDASLAIVKNKGIIDINQDELGVAATTFQPPGAPEPVDGEVYTYWAGPLSDGVAIGLTAAHGAASVAVSFVDVPGLGEGSFEWEEMYSGRTGNGEGVEFELEEFDMAVVKVTTS